MNNKITLTDPNGTKTEYDVVCHFKSTDDNHPKIKNLPILSPWFSLGKRWHISSHYRYTSLGRSKKCYR